MSSYELASLSVSALGFLAVAVSLIYLARQTRLVGKQTEHVAQSVLLSTYASVADQMLQIDSLFVEFPEIRPYFYEGQGVAADHVHFLRASAVAEQLLDYFDSVAIMMSQVSQVWPWEWWETYIIETFSNSPLLCSELRQKRSWYRSELFQMMERGEKRRGDQFQ